MTTVPEIVKILRDEERLGKLYQKTSPTSRLTATSTTIGDHKIVNQTQKAEYCRYEPKRTIIDLISPQDKYETIFHNYSVAITLADNSEHIVSWNKYTEELLHMKECDLFMKPVRSLYPPEEWDKIRKENVRQRGIRYRMETKMLQKNNELIDVEISLCILKGFQGELVGSIAIISDITELKKVERQLKESEKKYRTIFDNSAVAITMTDEKERIISWNRYAETLLGMNKNELYLRPVKELYPPAEWKKIRSQNIRQKGMQHHLETIIQKKNNEQIDVDISLSVLRNHEDRVVGSIGVFKDISEQKIIEKTLKESEIKFKLLYEKAPVPYLTLDPDGFITNVNEKWCHIFGYKKDQVLGKSIFDFISKNEKTDAKKSFLQEISQRKSYISGQCREYQTKAGKKQHCIAHDFLLYDDNGKVISVYTIMECINKEKQTSQRKKKIPHNPKQSKRKTTIHKKRHM